MHGLLTAGLDALVAGLDGQAAIDLEEARAREIEMNALEAGARAALLVAGPRGGERSPASSACSSSWMPYETAGNQLYRVAEALAERRRQPAGCNRSGGD